MTYVIIGNGPAGINAIESIRKLDMNGEIILISKEDTYPYSRIMTPEYMVGEVSESELFYRDEDFYKDNNVTLKLGQVVTRINPKQKTVVLDNNLEICYDRLLVATGSSPVVPAFANTGIKGVFTLWNKSDSEKIGSCLEKVSNAVIAGGGLIGLQAARALVARGIKVTIIEKLNRLMPLQLDEKAGDMLLSAARNAGIDVLLDTEASFFEEENGFISAVYTDKGKIKADLALISTGVRPNLSMTENSGLDMKRGLIVDKHMKTNIPDIYAAGDVAEAPAFQSPDKTLRALWMCAVQQGKIAGINMAGGVEEYEGSIAMNSIQLFGLSLISLGQLHGDGIEEKVTYSSSNGVYRKLLFREDRLVGLVLVGDIQQAGILYHKIGERLCECYSGRFSSTDPELIFA